MVGGEDVSNRERLLGHRVSRVFLLGFALLKLPNLIRSRSQELVVILQAVPIKLPLVETWHIAIEEDENLRIHSGKLFLLK